MALGGFDANSNAWIAGAVIGPVAFLAFAVAGGVLFWKRRERWDGRGRKQEQQEHPDGHDQVGKPELEGSRGDHITGVRGEAWEKPELDGRRDHVRELEPSADERDGAAETTATMNPAELGPDGERSGLYELEAHALRPSELPSDTLAKERQARSSFEAEGAPEPTTAEQDGKD